MKLQIKYLLVLTSIPTVKPASHLNVKIVLNAITYGALCVSVCVRARKRFRKITTNSNTTALDFGGHGFD